MQTKIRQFIKKLIIAWNFAYGGLRYYWKEIERLIRKNR